MYANNICKYVHVYLGSIIYQYMYPVLLHSIYTCNSIAAKCSTYLPKG